MTLKADKLEPAVFRIMLQRGRGAALMHVLAYGLDAWKSWCATWSK